MDGAGGRLTSLESVREKYEVHLLITGVKCAMLTSLLEQTDRTAV